MKTKLCYFLFLFILGTTTWTASANENDGFVPIFNGQNLDAWDGSSAIWSVEDGCIVGTTKSDEEKDDSDYSQCLIWRGGEVDDFTLKFDIWISKSGNSGMQFRSWEDVGNKEQPYRVYGYKADFDGAAKFSGTLYGENDRGTLARRGLETEIGNDHKSKEIRRFAEDEDLKKRIKIEDWNTCEITAKGYVITEKINGVVSCICTDNDKEVRRRSGLLAIPVHVGPAMKVKVKNIYLKRLPLENKKKIVLIGGPPSHGFGMHTHTASLKFLADWLNEYTDNILCTVYTEGWPKDPTALDNADCVMIFCDGGPGHLAIPHLDKLKKLMDSGKGIFMFHYAVDVPKGELGDFFLQMIGGYFEPFYTIAPWFNAEFKDLPDHPVLRGVKPFVLEDEWYYNIRFRPNGEGVVPLLSCVPPDSTRNGKDGYNSGNDTIRAGKGKNQQEIVAWCVERPDGGRGFGFTGGHYHWNWAHPDFRKFVLNALAWTAGASIPKNGIEVPTPTWEQLQENQVYEPNLSEEQIQSWKDKIKQWNQ